MISNLLRLLAPEQDKDSDNQPDDRLAIAALLVRVARTDGDYAEAEIQRIDKILTARFSLSPFEASDLRTQGEKLEAGAPDTVRFTRSIKETVSIEDRISVIEALWSVVLADGERDQNEDALLRLLARLLGVNDRDSNMARQRVQATLS